MSVRKKATAAAVAAVAVAGVAVNAAVDKPAELLPGAVSTAIQTEETNTSTLPKAQPAGFAAKLGAWLLRLPAAVRMLVILPLWCVGWVLLTALNAFTAGITTPLLARVLGWLCLSLVLAVVTAVGVKAMLPKTKLRKLLRLSNLLLPALAALLLCAADLILPSVWDSYGAVARWVWRIGGACLLAALCRLELRHLCREPQEEPQTASPTHTHVEQEAMRLADSVCPKL